MKHLILLFIVICAVSAAEAQSIAPTGSISGTQQAYFSVSNYGMSAGVWKSVDLSKRFSLNYGMAYSRYYGRYLNVEGRGVNPYFFSVDLPVELRYYVLPKDNRLTAFVYASAVPSLYDIQPLKTNVNIKFGGAVQYQINEHSSIYLRVNIYQSQPNFPGLVSKPNYNVGY